MCMCIKHMVKRRWVDRHGQHKTPLLVAILARVVDLKQSQANFLSYLTVWSYLQVVQMPISRDLAISMPTTMTTDRQTDYLTLSCMRAG